jgi:hypothetical protein
MLANLTTQELNIVCRALSLFQARMQGPESELARELYYRLCNESGQSYLPESMTAETRSIP